MDEKLDEELKVMRSLVSKISSSWALLSPASRVWVKQQLDSLEINPAPVEDTDKERV